MHHAVWPRGVSTDFVISTAGESVDDRKGRRGDDMAPFMDRPAAVAAEPVWVNYYNKLTEIPDIFDPFKPRCNYTWSRAGHVRSLFEAVEPHAQHINSAKKVKVLH